MAYWISFIDGVKCNERRQIVFLESDTDGNVNAKPSFDRFPVNVQHNLRARFEHWIDCNVCDEYFHGWSEEDRKDCFVFRWRKGTIRQRLYGFLFHPYLQNRRFQVCALVVYAEKCRAETDPGIITQLNAAKGNKEVLKVVEEVFDTAKENRHESTKRLSQKARPQLDGGRR